MRDEQPTLLQPLVCQECPEEWTDARDRWRLYLTHDDPAETLVYCPACAIREFGG